MSKKEMFYLVEMLRWGSSETHHYVVGIYKDPKKAVKIAEKEADFRGGKYGYNVYRVFPDERINLDINLIKYSER